MIPSGRAKCGFSYIGQAETAANARMSKGAWVPFDLSEKRFRLPGRVKKMYCRAGYEQKRAPNLMRVSGQLLSVRRTTRASRVLDFTWGISML
jgi:hypothetical protein